MAGTTDTLPGSSPALPPSTDPGIADILQLGDRLLGRSFSTDDLLPFSPPLMKGKLLSRALRGWDPAKPWQTAVKWLGVTTAFAAVDVPHLMLRLPSTSIIWALEAYERRRFARELVCPFCFSPQSERYVYCPACQRVQSSLTPALGEFLSRRCDCGRAKFRLLGNYKSPRPSHLVCRGSRTLSGSLSFVGCLRPLPEDVPWGRYPEIHIALAGPTRKKLAVLERLWTGLTGAKEPHWHGEPCWDLTRRELAYLFSTVESGVVPNEGPAIGLGYTLSRSGVFHVQKSRLERLLQFHNIAEASLRNDRALAMQSMHLVHDDALILVMDANLVDARYPGLSPHALIYSKLIRCVERLRGDFRAVGYWPRVAVFVPVESPDDEDVDPKRVSEAVRTYDPHLWGLLQHTAGANVKYFGGPLRGRLSPKWVHRLFDYVLGPREAIGAK